VTRKEENATGLEMRNRRRTAFGVDVAIDFDFSLKFLHMALLPGRLRQSTQESAEKNRGKGNENCKEKKIKNNKKRKNVVEFFEINKSRLTDFSFILTERKYGKLRKEQLYICGRKKRAGN